MFDRRMIGMACALLAGCAGQIDDGLDGTPGEPIAAAGEALGGAKGAELCDKELRLEHWIDAGGGVKIHVIEGFSGRSLLRAPRRAILMLPATLATNAWFDADLGDDASYNALHQAASRGFFGFAMSYEGFGKSTHPADGATVTAQRILSQTAAVVEWIRTYRGVPKVDVYGTSIGAGVAMALGGTESPINRHHIDRLMISTTVYKSFSPAFQAVYTPAYKASLLSLPGGYITTTPASYASIFSNLGPDALAWANANLPGQYPTGPILEVFDLPFFEAAPGRAPLIQFWGTEDPTTELSDVEQLQSEYGGPHQLVVFEGAGHDPMIEPVRHEMWDQAEEFLNEGSPGGVSLCDLLAPQP